MPLNTPPPWFSMCNECNTNSRGHINSQVDYAQSSGVSAQVCVFRSSRVHDISCVRGLYSTIPGGVPAISQRRPQLTFLRADDLTEQLQGRLRQEGRDHSGRQVCRKPGDCLEKKRSVHCNNQDWEIWADGQDLKEPDCEELTTPNLEKKICTYSGAPGLVKAPPSWPCGVMKSFSAAVKHSSHKCLQAQPHSFQPLWPFWNVWRLNKYLPADWIPTWFSEERKHILPSVADC